MLMIFGPTSLRRWTLSSAESVNSEYFYLMIKAIRRLLATLTFLAVVAAGIKAAFEWVAQSGDDDHEVFADDDRESV